MNFITNMDTNTDIYATKSLPWLKYYAEGAHDRAWIAEKDITIWQYIERSIRKLDLSKDQFVYFGRKTTRQEFIDSVYDWARVFSTMGIQPDERVVFFTPYTPQVAAMLFGLITIGATIVMPNLGSSKEAVCGSVSDARYAICYDGLFDTISEALLRPQFKEVIVIEAATDMPQPMRMLAKLANSRIHRNVMKVGGGKFIDTCQAMKRYGSGSSCPNVPFKPGRIAMVTASGGTTFQGHAKLVQVTNESMVAMVESALVTRRPGQYEEDDICLNMLPPFVSTSEFVLFMAPLYTGGLIVFEPRLSVATFTKSLLKYRPQITLMPGKGWEAYFDEVERMTASGKRPDLSHWKIPIIGGEGVTPEELVRMNRIMKECGSRIHLTPGYGMSEVFSVMSADFDGYDYTSNSRDCIQVGRPFAGFTMAVFDKDGNELPAGQRGELWVKAPTAMAGYLDNQELTDRTMHDGWIHTGDMFEMDQDGEFFCYGRMQDSIVTEKGNTVYTFDINGRLRHDADVRQAMVNDMNHKEGGKPQLAAHLALNPGCTTPQDELLRRLDADMKDWLPDGLEIAGYMIHKEGTFRTSPVMKTDKNFYKKMTSGYVKPQGDKLVNIDFEQ